MELPISELLKTIRELQVTVHELTTELGRLIVSPTAVALATILGTFLGFYRFVIKRPELILDIDEGFSHEDNDGETKFVAPLLLANVGRQYAEDVHLSFTLHGFEFDSREKGDALDGNKSQPVTMLNIMNQDVSSFFASHGIRHDLFFENVIYNQDVFSLYYGNMVFEEDGEYKIEYVVACRSHGPRTGTISLEVRDGTVEVNRIYPTIRRNLKEKWLGWELDEQKRTTQISEEYQEEINVEVTVKSSE